MDRLALLHAFVRTVDLGSMTAAAHELRVGQSTVSKWLVALEAEVGASLLDRTTRSHRVTPAGEALLRHARPLLDAWDSAITEAAAEVPALRGRLRVSLPSVFGQRHVLPHLGSFLDGHPELEVELLMSDRYVSLVDAGIDVAIRVGLAVPSSNRAVRIGGTERVLVASPSYLQRCGSPAEPDDLDQHHALVHSLITSSVWTLSRAGTSIQVRPSGRVSADHSDALRLLALQGHGIALLASWLVAEDVRAGRLIALLTDWRTPDAPIRAVFPPSPTVPARVRAFVDHVAARWNSAQP